MDKSATALDRVDARLEVFEQEVNERALQMIQRMSAPTALALQLPGTTSKYITERFLVMLYARDVNGTLLECVLVSQVLQRSVPYTIIYIPVRREEGRGGWKGRMEGRGERGERERRKGGERKGGEEGGKE